MSGKVNDEDQYLFCSKVEACNITNNADRIKHCAMGLLYALELNLSFISGLFIKRLLLTQFVCIKLNEVNKTQYNQ